MHCSMLGTTDILVDGTELIDELLVEDLLVVLVVGITEFIPGRIHECIHRIRISLCITAALGALAVHE